MPDTALEQAIKEAYAAAPSNVVILHTLEFRHQNFTQPIRVVYDHQNLNARLEASAPLDPLTYVDFIACAFDIQLPEVQHSATPEIVIGIDNVIRDIEDALAQAVASPYPVYVTYRPYLSTDLTGPQMDPPLTLNVNHVEADEFRVTARATYGDLHNRSFPSETYTASRFPGLAR